MLKKPDVNTVNILKLAGYIEEVPPEHFDMRDWCGMPCCIAGHGVVLFDLNPHNDLCRMASAIEQLIEELGLKPYQEDMLFNPGTRIPDPLDYSDVTPADAAKVLRHLAVTGDIDWSIIKDAHAITKAKEGSA